jgi:hypothetical protein
VRWRAEPSGHWAPRRSTARLALPRSGRHRVLSSRSRGTWLKGVGRLALPGELRGHGHIRCRS